ncbi:cytochrome c peroxidase [Halobacteriovorax sp. GB3]|uniref:cytochrome-c peroxidase n=1 Tax=Halobacteriovorax sp. GB3 TaxID=2719615 RepID=UPI0023610FBB|nr:cytochrome c peroxidase [Halobacteriovorax sp. GB3]MDD0852282.1 cytochrome c peroxidase [Halobacteriovorax sp. GB3]
MNGSFLLVFFSLISLNIQASDLDLELQNYIEKFNYQALGDPAESTEGEVKLGAALFFENALSGNHNINCATCHAVSEGLGDGLPLSLGVGLTFNGKVRVKSDGEILPRNAPHLFNVGFDEQAFMFWDGRVSYNESEDFFETPNANISGKDPIENKIKMALTHANSAQALFPILSHEEMLGKPGSNPIADLKTDEQKWQALVERLLYGPSASFYQKMFEKAFPDTKVEEINIGHVAEAIYAFEKHAFVINDTPWDRYLRGQKSALSDKQKRGAIIFSERARCAECHNGPHLSNFEFKNIAIPPIGPGKSANKQDYGRYYVTKSQEDKFKFKVPALRNVALTAPYMHNGAFVYLSEVIDHYDHVRHSFMHYSTSNINRKFRYSYQGDIERVFVREEVISMFENLDEFVWPPLFLTPEEKSDLLEFLEKSLTQKKPTFYRPW